jgi:hypothetical protein
MHNESFLCKAGLLKRQLFSLPRSNIKNPLRLTINELLYDNKVKSVCYRKNHEIQVVYKNYFQCRLMTQILGGLIAYIVIFTREPSGFALSDILDPPE